MAPRAYWKGYLKLGAQMPRYRFTIQDTDRFEDEDGVLLPDDQAARDYAVQIVHELQKADEGSWRSFTMDVIREGRVVWRIPFEVIVSGR